MKKTSPQSRASGVKFTLQVGFSRFHFRAFTVIELLVILAILALILAVLVPAIAKAKAKADRISCVGHLKNIGLANRIFATDNNDLFPWEKKRAPTTNQHSFPDLSNLTASEQVNRIFRTLSNELFTPKIIACPADKRKPAATWDDLTTNNIGYFLGTSSEEGYPQSLMAGDRNLVIDGQRAFGLVQLTAETKIVEWDGTIHKFQGNVAMGDGSVQQFSSARFREQLKNTGITNNVLAFP